MANRVDGDALQELEITRTKHQIAMLKADGIVDDIRVKNREAYLADLEAKVARAKQCRDMVTITKELKDGTVRERQCARVDVEFYERQGFTAASGGRKRKSASGDGE